MQALGCRLGQGYLFGAPVPAYRLLGQFLHPQGVMPANGVLVGGRVGVPKQSVPDDEAIHPHAG